MVRGLENAVILLMMAAILALWVWLVIRLFRRRNRHYSEHNMLGGTVRTVRSGPMFSASWTPNTGPAYLFLAVLSCAAYIAFMLFGFHPTLIAAFTVIAAVTYINQMRRKIGLGNLYAKAVTAVFLVTIVITAGRLILR